MADTPAPTLHHTIRELFLRRVSTKGTYRTWLQLLSPGLCLTPCYDRYPYNYHVYRVAQRVQVSSGPILPWFNQEGQGVQFEFAEKLVTLLGIGVLVEVMDFD